MKVLQNLSLLLFAIGAASASDLADPSAILQDLSKYSKLYVSYQNCAWSNYENGNDNAACGVAAGDDTYWYMGLTECFKANVAYSLYGVLKGQEDKNCTKATFINSFVTTTGVGTFITYMTTAGISFTQNNQEAAITSDCTVVQGNNNNQNNNNGAIDYSANNVKIYSSSQSYGVGCADTDKSFVLKEYAGLYCDERATGQVTDKLSAFNTDIGKAQCIAIYEPDNQNQASATDLLLYSQSCDIRTLPTTCPDPYGMLKESARSTASSLSKAGHTRREMTKTAFSWLLLCFGIILIMASAWAYFGKMQRRDGGGTKKKKSTSRRGLFTRSRSQDGIEHGGKAGIFTRSKSQDGSEASGKSGPLSKFRNFFSRNRSGA